MLYGFISVRCKQFFEGKYEPSTLEILYIVSTFTSIFGLETVIFCIECNVQIGQTQPLENTYLVQLMPKGYLLHRVYMLFCNRRKLGSSIQSQSDAYVSNTFSC